MQIYRHRFWRPLELQAHHPEVAQANVLRSLLAANRETTFGREHGFADITGLREFHERVPVQEYEMLRPYIERQRKTGETALTSEAPLFYAQTSGTTGRPKYIPVTSTSLAIHRAEQALFSYLQYRSCPEAYSGMAMGIMGAAVEGHLDSGHAVGSVSGHLYRSLPRFLQSRFVVPPAVSNISDYDVRYQMILHLALAQPNITYMGSPNPTTFVRLLGLLNSRRALLLQALATGISDEVARLEPSLRATIAPRLKALPHRAARLAQLPELTFANTWPNLKLLTTWTGGSCGIALGALRRTLPEGTRVMELGYQATECRGTIPIEAEDPGGLPPLHHSFFEFVEQTQWDLGRPDFLTLDQLQRGPRYYVLVTSAAGLYRYFMNDLIDVTGYFHRTPLVRFVQKGKGVTNLTGEKLYESQVIEAVQGEFAQRSIVPTFFVLVADEDRGVYRLFIETTSNQAEAAAVADDVDQRLGALNIEYCGKRDSGRLAPLVVSLLRPGAAEAFTAAAVRAGQREGQLKIPVLTYKKDLFLPLDDYVVP